jgi:parallel beta-helix repeat protein
MAKQIITPSTIDVDNIQLLPDVVVGQATELKVLFDKSPTDEKTYINDTLIAELNGDNGSKKIGHDSTNITADNVGDALEEIKIQANTGSTNLTTHKTSSDHDGRYYTETEVDNFTVKLTGNQTIVGVKTFTDGLKTSVTPTLPADIANRQYVDAVVQGIVSGSIPANSLTELQMSTAMKKQAGGVAKFNDVGVIADLDTLDKTSIVNAVNETLSTANLAQGTANNAATQTAFNTHLADMAIYLKRYATGDGSDETTEIQSAFNAAEGKTLIINNPISEYGISSTIEIPSNTIVIAMGKPTIKLLNSSNVPMFNIVGKTNVTIEGLILDGNRVNQVGGITSNHGIIVINSTNINIKSNEIKNCSMDGIGLGGILVTTGEGNTNKKIKISNNEIYSNGQNGISLVHVDGVDIEGNTIHDNHAYVSTLGSGIDIEPNPGNGAEVWICRNINISGGNHIYDNNVGVQLVGCPSASTLIIEDINISNNIIIKNTHATTVNLSRDIAVLYLNENYVTTKNIIIANNVLGQTGQSNSEKAIYLELCHCNILINANIINKVSVGITLLDCSKIKITENHITEFSSPTSGVGISLAQVTWCVIEDNYIANGSYSNSFLFGIAVTASLITRISTDNIIRNNTIAKTSASFYMYVGIDFTSNNAAWAVIERNTVMDNNIKSVSSTAIRFTNVTASANYIEINLIDGIKKISRNGAFYVYQYEADYTVPTVSRPSTNLFVGLRVFDTTLGKPIWLKTVAGPVWVDGVGTTV